MNGTQNKILVTGDVCIDWNVATVRSSERHNLWKSPEEWVCNNAERSGAYLLGKLIAKVIGVPDVVDYRNYEKEQPREKPNVGTPIDDDGSNIDALYTLWRCYAQSKQNGNDIVAKQPEKLKKGPWRISQYLGHRPRQVKSLIPAYTNFDKAPILFIDDKRFGFRDETSLWKDCLGEAKIIVLRMARELCEGDLWKELINNHSEKLVTVFTASDLRDSDVRVSKELSWEQTAQDVRDCFQQGKLKQLQHSRYTIVSFDYAGVILYDSEADDKWRLFYNPKGMEGDNKKSDNGRINGYTYCLLAAIAKSLFPINFNDKYNISETLHAAIKSGMSCMAKLYRDGYEAQLIEYPNPKSTEKNTMANSVYCQLCFPVAGIVQAIQVPDEIKYGDVIIPAKDDPVASVWTILSTALADAHSNQEENIPVRLVKEGIEKVLPFVPTLELGQNTYVVDRSEIESLRSMGNLIAEYVQKAFSLRSVTTEGDTKTKPLSIAVFGEPGSGKSFIVKKLADLWHLQVKLETKTFNLSQFSKPEDLTEAFHQIRDIALSGDLPLVFWDEFDCYYNQNALGWLPFFLAPMQDGVFQEGQITHRIGRGIFVFAGGTNECLEEFQQKANENSKSKARDFLSRLKGSLDVAGINPKPLHSTAALKASSSHCLSCPARTSSDDLPYKVKRAIVLRAMLFRHAETIFDEDKPQIDDSVIQAFLNIKQYKHGVRSLESIVTMSRIAGEVKFTRSALPPEAQLDLHVEGKEFLELAAAVN